MIPTIEFTNTGIIAPERQAVTNGLWQMFDEAFGVNFPRDMRTPQGQLVTSLTAIINNANDRMVELGNNFDPRYAVGQFQEALAAIYFIDRKFSTKSVAQLKVTGLPTTVIPAGFIVIDDDGIEWEFASDYTIGPDLADIVCREAGPVRAAADTITQIKQSLEGLDRVTNPAAAAVGEGTESRVEFERRRRESVSKNGKLTTDSVLGAVFNLEGVLDCQVIQNPTDESVTVGVTDYPMIRNSLLVSVVGGDAQEIAETILIKGGTGCTLIGNTTVNFTDDEVVAAPSYPVKFLRPTNTEVYIQIVVIDQTEISYQNKQNAINIVMEAFTHGENRARIGGLIIGADYMCALDFSTVRPVKIQLSTDGTTWHDTLEMGIDQLPVTSTFNIEIVDP